MPWRSPLFSFSRCKRLLPREASKRRILQAVISSVAEPKVIQRRNQHFVVRSVPIVSALILIWVIMITASLRDGLQH